MADCRVHHCVPSSTELIGDLRHGAAPAPDLDCRPATRRVRQSITSRRDLRHLLGERACATSGPAALADLAPHQARWPSQAREISVFDLSSVFHPHRSLAAGRPTGCGSRVSTRIRSPASLSVTSSTCTSGNPTSSSHMRVASDDPGALRLSWRKTRLILRAPVPRPADPSAHPTALIPHELICAGTIYA
jgi:hypothetical protein